VAHRAAVKGAGHFAFRCPLAGDGEGRVDRSLRNPGDAAQSTDLFRRLDGADTPEKLEAGHQPGVGQFAAKFLPVSRQQSHLVDGDTGPRQPGRLDRGNQCFDGVAVVGKRIELGPPAIEIVERRIRPVDLEITVSPDILDPDVLLVGDLIQQRRAGDDFRRRKVSSGQQNVDLRSAPDPLRQRPIATGVGDVLR
jgi:hypothetical protein